MTLIDLNEALSKTRKLKAKQREKKEWHLLLPPKKSQIYPQTSTPKKTF